MISQGDNKGETGNSDVAEWDAVHDVIVVGSGASGCVAAIFAHQAGAKTLVVEKGPVPGGTSAKSGGQFWIPNNRLMRDASRADLQDAFLRYVARASFPGQYNGSADHLGIPADVYDLMATYHQNAAPVIEALEAAGDLKYGLFSLSPEDKKGTYNYYSYLPEDEVKWGRTLSPIGANGPGGGQELIDQLSAGLKRRSVEILLRHQATGLVRGVDGKPAGLVVETPVGRKRLRARRGIIFASGGFGQDRDKLLAHQIGPVLGSCAVPSATGDVIDIVSRFGARLDNMSGGWRAPVVLDHAVETPSVQEDAFWPPADSGFFVNRVGKRCVNERANYHSRVRSMYRWDENGSGYPDLLHIYVYDQRASDLYAGLYPHPLKGDDRAGWVVKAKDFVGLTNGIDQRLAHFASRTGGIRLAANFADELAATTERFNRMARAGTDKEFGRGSSEADLAIQDYFIEGFAKIVNPDGAVQGPRMPNSTMYPLADFGPYYAIILAPGLLDTNGGPKIDRNSRLLDYRDRPIPNLFGAGNCIASPARNAYWGAGVTLGLGMTFGAIAGRNAAAGPDGGVI